MFFNGLRPGIINFQAGNLYKDGRTFTEEDSRDLYFLLICKICHKCSLIFTWIHGYYILITKLVLSFHFYLALIPTSSPPFWLAMSTVTRIRSLFFCLNFPLMSLSLGVTSRHGKLIVFLFDSLFRAPLDVTLSLLFKSSKNFSLCLHARTSVNESMDITFPALISSKFNQTFTY